MSYQAIVQLIAATTTEAGLKVRCELDQNTYPAGIKVSDAEIRTVNLVRHDFHGEWNYTISPKLHPLKRQQADETLGEIRDRPSPDLPKLHPGYGLVPRKPYCRAICLPRVMRKPNVAKPIATAVSSP